MLSPCQPLAHRAFFLDDEEKDRAVALMRRVEAGVKASMSYCINRTVSISSDHFDPPGTASKAKSKKGKAMGINRRHFIFGSAAAVSLAGCTTHKVGARQLKPGEKRTVALIGCGKQIHHLAKQFLKNDKITIVAACDCDRVRAPEIGRAHV